MEIDRSLSVRIKQNDLNVLNNRSIEVIVRTIQFLNGVYKQRIETVDKLIRFFHVCVHSPCLLMNEMRRVN
jgi:hypothetical protein